MDGKTVDSADNEVFGTENSAALNKRSTDTEIVSYIKQKSFITQKQIAEGLSCIHTDKLERIAREVPTIAGIIYDVVLEREEMEKQKDGKNTKYENENRVFGTPRTPYNKWCDDIFRFTRLDLETAKKLGAVLRRKYVEVRTHEVVDVVRKLEQMCVSTGFTETEKGLALALLNIAIISKSVSPKSILHIASILKRMEYMGAENTLLTYYEEIGQEVGEYVVVECIKERRDEYAWCMKMYLAVHPNRASSVFREVKADIEQLAAQSNPAKAVELMKPIYIHSTEELEQEIRESMGSVGIGLISECEENIWS